MQFNPLTPEFPPHGVPRSGALRHNIILNSFLKISKPIFRHGNNSKDLQAGISALQEFVMVGEAGFFGLTGWEG